MMIFGFAMTAGIAGKLLDPYTPERLLMVSGGVSALAMLIAAAALWRVEPLEGDRPAPPGSVTARSSHTHQAAIVGRGADGFRVALADVWAEPAARRFTFFVFLSMLAYSSQDLILEPFAGLVFAWTPGESTALSGVQHAGVLVGMLIVAACTGWGRGWMRSLAFWSVGGCLLSAAALALLAAAGLMGPPWPLRATVALMGAANGMFSIAAIASMMRLAGHGRAQREGTRVGLWGAAQALAFGLGGLAGAMASDMARWLITDVGLAYAGVFALESLLFVGAATLAWQVSRMTPSTSQGISFMAQPTGPSTDGAGHVAPAHSTARLGATPPQLAS
jgi:BCD family chlorophyll transporter-like MFS transporter